MSSKHRHKRKKQNLKQTEINRLPHARRKGGQYIYPAGAYRQAMIAPPKSMPLPSVPATVREEIAVTEPAPVIEQTYIAEPQTAEESRRRWLYYAAAVLTVIMMAVLLMPRPSAGRTAGLTKLVPDYQRLSSIELADAEKAGELKVMVDMETLRQPLEEYLSTLDGDWAVWVKNLSNDQVLSINDHQMPSASLIKLFVAGCYYEQLESGAISSTQYSEYDLAMMISWSDNAAWEDLETYIGRGSYEAGLQKVTAFARSHGYNETGRLIGSDSIYTGDNLTSASDVGRVLDEINQGTYVSENASREILELMKDQHIVTKIPAGLPEGVRSANKTGELVGIENDAAIVYGQNTDYILVVMSDGNNIGTQPVVRISEIVYEALNPGGGSTEDL